MKIFLLTDISQIMRLYEEIIKDRASKNPDYRNGLLELESKRRYREREEQLRRDIAKLEADINGWRDRLSRLDGDWKPQVILSPNDV